MIEGKRMKHFLVLLAALVPIVASGGDGQRLEESRALVQRFSEQLQAELLRAMSGEGPEHAITVCAERAPLIAAELARESGAKIGRTSLKFRNPSNAPEPWQYEILQRFDALGPLAAPASLEVFEAEPAAGVEARYMKAIPAKPMCLACHGEPQGVLREAIKDRYPHDRATGYEAGDIRGAFYVIWPERPESKD